MRSQIFAKSLPMALVIGARKRLELLKTDPSLKDDLWKIVDALQDGLREAGFNIGTTTTCVTPVILSGTVAEATHLTYDLRENYNIFCSIVMYPVVPKGVIMLRLIPTAVHSLDDVKITIQAFKEIARNLAAGKYVAEKLVSVN
jgi:glycine C-acetyltransferase